jgi:hypothetical protein
MNTDILNFIKELRDLTGETFVYRVEAWNFSHATDMTVYHTISSNMDGFKAVQKETETELIDSKELIRKLVIQLLVVRNMNDQLKVKLIGSN